MKELGKNWTFSPKERLLLRYGRIVHHIFVTWNIRLAQEPAKCSLCWVTNYSNRTDELLILHWLYDEDLTDHMKKLFSNWPPLTEPQSK